MQRSWVGYPTQLHSLRYGPNGQFWNWTSVDTAMPNCCSVLTPAVPLVCMKEMTSASSGQEKTADSVTRWRAMIESDQLWVSLWRLSILNTALYFCYIHAHSLYVWWTRGHPHTTCMLHHLHISGPVIVSGKAYWAIYPVHKTYFSRHW